MKFARYWSGGSLRVGVVVDKGLIDLADAAPMFPRSITQLLALEPHQRRLLDQRIRAHTQRAPLSSIHFGAPVDEPRRFIAVGLNYKDHALEMGETLPTRPRLFVKLAGTLTGPFEAVAAPAFSATLDYEAELAFVIGRRCRNVPRTQAHAVIGGYLVLNDFSIREYVNPDLLILGKGCAGFAPCGPYLVTADEVPDPQALHVRTWVNGELRQDSSTAQMIFDCGELIERITRAVALEPGDLVTTGSPPGTGASHRPQTYLKPGDVVRAEITGLGAIENRIVPEAPSCVEGMGAVSQLI